MKDKLLKSFCYKMTLQIVLKILVCVAGMIFFLFLIDNLFAEFLRTQIYQWSPSLYYLLVNSKNWILAILFFGTLFLCIYSTVRKFTGYIRLLLKAIDQVFQKEKNIVNLPKDFYEIQDQLKSIQMDMLQNEQAAKEAEQRKNDLVVYLAHDLKTPLTSVIGYIHLIRDQPEIPERLRQKYLEIALNKALRLESLINEFFEITRFNLQSVALEVGEIHLSLMLRQMIEEFYPSLTEKQLTCDLQAQDGVIILGDPDKLARVFDNLLRNAINYSRVGSVIRVGLWKEAHTVLMKFRNVGTKIPEHKLQSIFEKFYRLDDSRSSHTGGAGLGLAIAKQIVELHGGSIAVQSNDQFTEFTVCLPLYQRPLEEGYALEQTRNQ